MNYFAEELRQRESDILKLLALADIISPGIILNKIFLKMKLIRNDSSVTFYLGLSRLRGTLLYYLVKFQLARFIQGFELHSKNMMAPAKITELEV